MGILQELVVKITGETTSLDKSIDKSDKKVGAFAKKLGDLGKKMTMFVTLPILGAGAAAVKSAADFEKHRVAFETMMGSVSKAQVLLARIQEFSATTPFQLPGLIQGAKRLLAFGVAAEDIVETMTRLGNAAQGDQAILDRLTLAFGKLRAKGRATMEELNMFTEAGVPILDALAKKYEVTTGELFKMIETGKVGFEDVNEALTNLTTGAGMFAGLIEKQAQTLSGLISTLKDNIGLLAKEFGEILLPDIKKIAAWMTNLIRQLQAMSEQQKRTIITLAKIAAAIGPILIAVSALNKVMAMNPYAAIAGAIALIVTGLIAWRREAANRKSEEALGAISEHLVDSVESGENLVDAIRRVAAETGLAERQVAELAHAEGLVTDELREQIDLIRERSGEEEKSAKQVVQQNLKIMNDLKGFILPEMEPEVVVRLVREIADGYGIALERAVALALRIEWLKEEQRGVLLALQQTLRPKEEGYQLSQWELDLIRKIVEEEKARAAITAAVVAERKRLAEFVRSTDQERIDALDEIQLHEEHGILSRKESQRQRLATELEFLTVLVDEGILFTHNRAVGKDMVALAKDRIAALREELGLTGGMSAEVDSVMERYDALQKVKQSIAAQEQRDSGKRTQFYFAQMDQLSQEKVRINELKDVYIQAGIDKAEAEKWAQERIAAAVEAAEKRKQSVVQATFDLQQMVLGFFSDVANSIANIVQSSYDRQLQASAEYYEVEQSRLDDWYEAEKAKLGFSAEAELQRAKDAIDADNSLTEVEKENAKSLLDLDVELAEKRKDLDEEQAERQKQLEYDAAKRVKAFAIFQAGLDIPSAILNALTVKPAILIPAAVAFAIVTGAANLAAILSQPLPALAEGGFFKGPAVVGEGGKEFALPLRDDVMNRLAEAIVRQPAITNVFSPVDARPMNVSLSIDGKKLDAHIQRSLDDRRILVGQGSLKS